MSSDLKSEDYKEIYGGSEKSNQLLKILLMKMFSNHSDFCFHITIHEILDKKSLYGRKKFISEKKIITKNFEKKTNFFKIITEGDGGGTLRSHFRNLQKIWW